jgi:hypothetical protein
VRGRADDEGDLDSLERDGERFARRRIGEERDPVESPCPGCGAYFFDVHVMGCEEEECPVCGDLLCACMCFGAPHAG